LTLVLSFNGTVAGGNQINFDDIDINKWVSVNLTHPVQPPPPPPPNLKINSDGFPAQALQVYWVLMKHGYTNDSIFLMLYHTGDTNGIDINRNDGIVDDLAYAGVDVENDNVNSTRFKRELNVSISGSFASKLIAQDQLIIFMVDHGSNRMLGDGNATFHFEADNKYITELEFYNLVKNIKCNRILINVDCCFSGNFLNQNNNIGQSWYNLPNCILVSAASNVFSWYWINNFNGDNFAGSWFFHPFWDQLNKSQTILTAYNFACLFSPAIIPPTRVVQIQRPLMKDYLGIANSWTL